MNKLNDLLSTGIPTQTTTIDWISCTAHDASKDGWRHAFPNLRDAQHWHLTKGALGYDQGAKHTMGIKQYTSTTRKDMGTHIIYSGSALRRVEEMYGNTPLDVLTYHVLRGDHIQRLDIAIDLINTGVQRIDFENAWMLNEVKTRIKTATTVRSLNGAGYTFYIGSRKARKKLVRIYDKGAEQGIAGVDWTRAEVQLMGKPALNAAKRVIYAQDVRAEMLSVFKGVVDFPTVKQWRDVFDNVTSVTIGSITSEKGDTREWLRKQVVPALAKEIVLDESFWIQFGMWVESEVDAIKRESGGV